MAGEKGYQQFASVIEPNIALIYLRYSQVQVQMLRNRGLGRAVGRFGDQTSYRTYLTISLR